MRVLYLELDPGDRNVVERAAAQLDLSATEHPDLSGPTGHDGLLAAFGPPAALRALPDGLATIRVAVVGDGGADAVAAAVADGAQLALPSPLQAERVRQLLSHLLTGAPPESALRLWLEPDGHLSSGDRSCTLTAEEARLLRLLGGAPGRVLRREQLGAPDTLNATILQLTHRLEEIRSGARILKVAHLGYRLSGTLVTGGAITRADADVAS